MKKALIVMAAIFSASMAEAQRNSTEKQAIEKQVDAMINSWNIHNYSDMKSYTAADCDWVNHCRHVVEKSERSRVCTQSFS